jgi:hypothetical protein
MAIIIQKLDKLDNRAAESSSSRKHPRPTQTNTEDFFVNQNTLNNISINMPANTNNMDTDNIPQPDTFYNQLDDDPKQDNEQRSR